MIENSVVCSSFNNYDGFENYFYKKNGGYNGVCMNNCENYTNMFYTVDNRTNR